MTSLEERLGYEFKDRTLLETALTHTSWANEHGLTHKDSNERLEFLGDSVLSHIVAHKLYNEHDAYSEGELTRTRAALVCESSLSEFAKQIGLGADIKLGKGEDKSGGRDKASILSDCFEAVLAAIYLDGGYDIAEDFVLSFIKTEGSELDSKSELQKYVQENGYLLEYILVDEQGPEHMKEFTFEARINGECVARGKGSSKHRAEMDAASKALKALGITGE